MSEPHVHGALARTLGVWGLVATGVSTMVGGAINVLPLTLHRAVPGIGADVPLAYALAAIPAVLAGLVYARLAAAMPRAGGSFVYISRAMNPFIGFLASFAQWFGFSVVIGVVAYLIAPFLLDLLHGPWPELAGTLGESTSYELGLPIVALWVFVLLNLFGSRAYELTLVPLTILMAACFSVVIVSGFLYGQEDFLASAPRLADVVPPQDRGSASPGALLAGAAVLFGSFIGFETIAQAAGEARDPRRTLPIAITLSITGVAAFYVLFTLAVYHVVPWWYARAAAATSDLTVPAMMGHVLPPGWAMLIGAGATLALLNHLPAMVLAASRMLLAWAEDGMVPSYFAAVDSRRHTPDRAIIASALVATCGILGCHLAGDFLLGIDILTTTILLNFVLVSISLLMLQRRSLAEGNADILTAGGLFVRVLPVAATVCLLLLLGFHVHRDLVADGREWYFRSTWLLLGALALAAFIHFRFRRHSDAR